MFSLGYSGSPWILPFTAGGFIYIATTSVLPSLLEGESLKWKQSLLEFLAIVVGIVLMLLVGVLE
jgi:solute carrier family 39 (zinc transporter), member 7